MDNSNKLFIVLVIGLIVGLGIYMINKLDYIKKMETNEEETTTSTTISNTTTSDTTTNATTQHITLQSTSKKTTTTIKTNNTNNTTNKTTTSTTTKNESSAVEEARKLANQESSQINNLLTKVNNLRQENGVNTLSLDNNLNTAACIRAQEMANARVLSHTRPNGSSCYTVLKELNIKYKAAGENVANSTGVMDSNKAYESWFNSRSHYENMIDKDYTKMGACYAKNSNGETYWAQLFMK